MYPDTDLPPKKIGPERLAAIRSGLPPSVQEREKWYRELGIPADVVESLSISPSAGLFEKAVKSWGLDPKTAAVSLIQYPKRLRKKGLKPTAGIFEEIFEAVREKRLYREGILPVLEASLGGNLPVREALPASAEGDPAGDAARIAAGLRGRRFQDEGRRMRRAMGLLMADWRGRIEGSAAAAVMAAELRKVKP